MKIRVENVSKKFGNNVILKDINLEFNSGKIYGLVGRNGSGKSIILKILCGFYEPNEGKVFYDDSDIFAEKRFPPSTRALIEKPFFIPELTGKENLNLLARIQNKIDSNQIDEVLKKLDLYDEKDKKFHKYSLGMKQKLGIAQVLMEEPKVIILDEPFSGLDEDSVVNVRKILLEEKTKGQIVVLATHIKDDIDKLCDEVYLINACSAKKI